MYKSMISLKLLFLILLLGFSCIIIYFQTELNNLNNNKHLLETRLAQLQSEIQQLVQQQLKSNTEKLNNDNLVVIYNRVPKTGSTSFVGVPYDLCKRNNFHVLHINVTANMHVLTLPNQLKFVQNVTNWNSVKPALYHGHMAFINFARFGVAEKPLYINLIRKPLDRLVSYYYFLRNGDDFRPYLVRKKHGNKMTFDDCIKQKQFDCDPNNMWLQVPFFCGHSVDCWQPGNQWALNEAKRNLLNHYLLVGVTEQMTEFIAVLEATVPRLFNGASEHFRKSNKAHLRKTIQKIQPSEATINAIKLSTVWQMENEFYLFALQQFQFIKRRVINHNEFNNSLQIFFYEKIRPK